jgi:RNA polymerase sigma-70 factor (ECF subfamily)
MDTERIDDRPLLERFRQGDRDALATLYRSHHPAIFRFALYMTDDPDAAAEVVQEAFLWLIHHPDAFDPDRGSLRSFLSGVARKMLQHRARTSRRFQSLSPALHSEPATSGSVEHDIDAETDARKLRAAILSLPEAYREAIILCGIENKSYEEAAAILDCAVGTVRSRVHRAKQHLNSRLSRPGSQNLTLTGRPTHE